MNIIAVRFVFGFKIVETETKTKVSVRFLFGSVFIRCGFIWCGFCGFRFGFDFRFGFYIYSTRPNTGYKIKNRTVTVPEPLEFV